ncbi:MAG: cobalamin B12-binding domain-containing protein [Betaproteobacteria bacterium]
MSEAVGYKTDSETIERFSALRHQAIEFVTAESLAAGFGPRTQEPCAEDIAFHLDFLRPTLESGDLSPFIAYLAWLSQVLSSRSIPGDSLPHSLDHLAIFFTRSLGENSAPIVAVLMAGKAALAANLAAPCYDHPCPVPWSETTAFCEALLEGNSREAAKLFSQAIDRESSLPGTEVHVIQPALYEIGRRWQQNRVSVAQEHVATEIAQSLMALGAGCVEAGPANGLKVLFACTAGNHHALGLRMVADAFELSGWAVNYLGANTPNAALVSHVRQMRPDIVCLSASMPHHLRDLRQVVAMLRTTLTGKCPRIVVGGLVFNQFPLLVQGVGADLMGVDAISTLNEVVRMMEK